jgi:hypothetical protein
MPVFPWRSGQGSPTPIFEKAENFCQDRSVSGLPGRGGYSLMADRISNSFDESPNVIDEAVDRLEQSWRTSGAADLGQLVAFLSRPLRDAALAVLIPIDQEHRWQRGH